MRIVVKGSAADASATVADLLLRQLAEKPVSVLGLPTGGTPLGVYAHLRNAYRQGRGSYRSVTTFNLDEYLGLPPDDPQSYAAYMRENLFDHVDIDMARAHIPNGRAPDAATEAMRYESMIAARGGIDVMLLGLGCNAHIGFNEPGSPHDSRTRRVRLAQTTLDANAVYFPTSATQPTHAITMGIGTILASRQILVLATGEAKAAAVAASVSGPPSLDVPGSALLRHPNTTFVLDRAAAWKLEQAQTWNLTLEPR